MARKPRLEFEGAIDHVINRGNYQKDLFVEKGAAAAFARALFEACEKGRWIVHAYVLMSNHYHLAWETPEANLLPGMAWLQETFANRFNRFRGEREVGELREEKWGMALAALLRQARKSCQAIDRSAKSAEWRIRIARAMKRRTTATNPWLAAALRMGHPSRVGPAHQ
jgi:REP element-mobilizing transposase RayT